jgi:flagella basal body P-ring formation protein FlgA
MRSKRGFAVCLIALSAAWLVLGASPSQGRERASSVERQLTDAVKEISRNGQDVYVKVDKMPLLLSEGAKIKGIDVVKAPDTAGSGLALVRYEGADSRVQSSFVAFKTYEKKQLFYLNRSLKRGERIEQGDVETKGAYVGEKSYLYPESFADLNGKVLRKDMPAGSLVTFSVIEEPQAIKRGQDVIIICQNNRITVQTTGKASENGRRGVRIRVKNVSSEREVFGRIVDNNTVVVDF